MQSKIRRRQPVALHPSGRPSRIRRDPVRIVEDKARLEQAAALSEEREIWGGVAGIVLMAASLAVAIVGISIATLTHGDPAADARAEQFDQCYLGGPNCVVDGNTIHVAGRPVSIAGVIAPRIQGARCPEERSRGIDTAVRLADMLNRGTVTVGEPMRDSDGELRQTVEVNGRDIGLAMINAGIARDGQTGSNDWCSDQGQ